jgi:hypothetical protein
MITTSADDVGRHLGSVIIQSPAGGHNYFFSPAVPESEVVSTSLKKKKSTDFWAAIVAGDDRSQIVANAQAAIADATARQRAGTVFASPTGNPVTPESGSKSMRMAGTVRAGRICKTGCSPD